MAEFFDHIPEKQIAFIREQPMFFIASACASGRINLSPKGGDCFRVLDANTFAYLDMTGSGNETSAHIKNDGRVTVMFNSFSRNPLILRLYGQGRVLRPHHGDYPELIQHFTERTGSRQIVIVDVESVQTSCGYSVPLMELTGHRDTLNHYWEAKGDPETISEYHQTRNKVSIDGFETGIDD